MSPLPFAYSTASQAISQTWSRLFLKFLLDMEVAHRNHEMDRVCTEVCGIVDVLAERPDIGADLGREAIVRDEPDRLPFTLRGCGRAGLYDVDADLRELPGDLEFLNG